MAENNNNTPEKKNKFAETRESFVNAVIESLEKGKVPWQKTWDADCGNNLFDMIPIKDTYILSTN